MAELTEAAFGDFYRRDARAVWTYVYRATGNTADADDIVQEAFVRVLRADVGGLGEEDLRRYIFRVAGNLMADRWRKATRERKYAEREAPVSSSGASSNAVVSGLSRTGGVVSGLSRNGGVVSGFSRTSGGPPEGGHHARPEGGHRGELTFYSSGDVVRARRSIEVLLGLPVDRVLPLPV